VPQMVYNSYWVSKTKWIGGLVANSSKSLCVFPSASLLVQSCSRVENPSQDTPCVHLDKCCLYWNYHE
jgi:hypothetical protein